MIAEGRGEDIASPRVITSNQNEAVFESGVQIPYQEASSSGATSTSFQDATLSLRVTPQITPDDRIIMDLEVNQDTVSATVVNGVPAINTRSVTTQVWFKMVKQLFSVVSTVLQRENLLIERHSLETFRMLGSI